MEVEDAIEKIPEIVKEYIVEDSLGMKQFLDYSKQQQDLLALQGVLTKEERVRVYEIENRVLDSLRTRASHLEEVVKSEESKEGANAEFISFLRQSLESDKSLIAAEEERQTIISPMDARNKYKEADLWKYQECFASTLKAAVVTMNKMEMVSFKGAETASDRGTQGHAIKEAAARLRDRDNWEGRLFDLKQITTDIATLFDYPKSDIDLLPKDKIDLAAPRVVNDLFNRHIKLTYDSFEGFRNLSENDIKAVMQQSFSKFKKAQGWSKNKDEYPYPNSHQNIDEENGTYALPAKFHALKSRSLTSAIKELEAQVKAGIEDQVEEEQSQSRDSQEDKKPSARNISRKSVGGRF